MRNKLFRITLLCVIMLLFALTGACTEEDKEAVYLLKEEEIKTFRIEDGGKETCGMTGKSVYEYDKKGNKIKSTEYSDGEIVRTYSYTYDENGNVLTQTILYESSSSETVITYTYDENGRVNSKLTVDTWLEDKGKLEEYTYDERGNVIATQTTYDDAEPEAITREYTYDDNGNIVKCIRGEEGQTYIDEYTYDENGNVLIQIDGGDKYREAICYEYEYDDNNNCIKKTEYEAETGKILGVDEYVYNKNNNLIKTVMKTDSYRIESVRTYKKLKIEK